ncbi:TlpA disulfide reductase family protein [Mucilaginibacter psychrotolerans]|uniref:AhpC/TSA family protein n=1 Tax=Mucilaginibacter psychrotolerans TaxID=1524096 RepID=A0A4Y8S4B7_9SPHI|nr:TlpA disulfide reductase family protein [Mucilaginibacter psychrotolerans]TFF33576.1 AhpC/TSA family protein [Mucilaginibacter psychrotolerans]
MCSKWGLIFLLLLASPAVLYAQRYSISGKIAGFKNNSKVYLVDGETDEPINSTVLKEGIFYLKGNLKNGPMYLSVVIHEGKNEYACEVFAGGGDVSITGSKKDFPYNVNIDGPAEQRKFNAYQQLMKAINKKSDSLKQVYLKVRNDSIAARQAAINYNKTGDEYQTNNKKLINQNSNSYYAAMEFHNYLPEMGRDSIQRVYNGLSVPIQQSIYGKRIQTYLTMGDTLKVNDKIYDFEAYDAGGKNHFLSSYTDKYILLDFSSVHCGPCIAAADELRLLSQKYKGSLHVISFSPDKKAEWLQGIKNDKATWISLTDGQGDQSKALLKYGVITYPTFFIIAPGGLIAEKWLGYEKLKSGMGNLEKHLVRYLNKP